MQQPLSSAEIRATRHLVGLSRKEFSQAVGVTEKTLYSWEAGSYRISDEPAQRIIALRAAHDAALIPLLDAAGEMPISFPLGDTAEHPAGWWISLAARVLDRNPTAEIEFDE